MFDAPPLLDAEVLAAFRGRRVMITGAGGFIARHLTATLLPLAGELILVDHTTRRAAETWPPEWPPIARLSIGDDQFAAFYRAAGRCDYLFHLAGRAHAAGSVAAPVEDFTYNLAATVNLLEVARTSLPPGRLIFASSAAVYGNPVKTPIDETDPTLPIAPYGVSKLAAERYVAVYARLYGLPAASLRLFSVYGPYQTKQVVYDFFQRLRSEPERLTILGDGTQMRDFVYVADVVRALLVVAVRGRHDGFAYNVASGQGTTTRELARLVAEISGGQAQVVCTGERRPGDPERWIGRARPLAEIDGTPRYSLRAGLRATAAWLGMADAPLTGARRSAR